MDCVLRRQSLGFLGQVRWLALLLSSLQLAPLAASLPVTMTVAADGTSSGLESEKCETSGSCEAAPASNLLQIAAKTGGHDDNFGPGSCVSLKRSSAGSCELRTRCKGNNISNTEFAFVCFNPGASMPHALHSFGRGGFSLEETFDTKVWCKTCISVDTAFRTGDSVVRNALAALPLSRLPSLSGAVQGAGVYSIEQLAQFKPKEAAVFGPEFCISTFRAPAGTCLIRTRCPDIDLSKFNVGVTCLDQSGGYTRYLFGKDSFKPEETFDTLVTCEKCLGVGPESSQFALHGLMPRKLVEDVNTLKIDVQTLREKVRVLQEHSANTAQEGHHHHKKPEHEHGPSSEPWTMPDTPSDTPPMPPAPAPDRPGRESGRPGLMPPHPHKQEFVTESESSQEEAEEEEAPMPTIMMSRRQRPQTSGRQQPQTSENGGMDPGADVPEEPEQDRGTIALQDAGAESAAIDVGDSQMQIVTHRRTGSAIAELFRRVKVKE